jgi:hypothetical protein
MPEPSVVQLDHARNVFRRAIEEITDIYGPGSEETAALGMLTFAARDFLELAGRERALDVLQRLQRSITDEPG